MRPPTSVCSLSPLTDGRRLLAAKSAIRALWVRKNGSARTRSASARSPVIAVKAGPGRTCRLSHHELVAAGVRILEDGDPGDPGHGLFEQLQLFSNDLGGNARQPGDIAAGPPEAVYEPTRNRIGN